jgi:hypothetical protein
MEDLKVNIPEGVSGDWKVEKFIATKKPPIRFLTENCYVSFMDSGEHTRLVFKNKITVMSDTPTEIFDHKEVIEKAKGKILINGLGLGLVIKACLDKPEVEHITVIEISPDVIKLVGQYYSLIYGDRLTIIQSDAFEYQPPEGVRYDVVWHDIWNEISSDNWKQYKFLYEKYKFLCDWQGSWCEKDVEEIIKRKS